MNFIDSVQHEVLHVLGFGHEHQRPDRDEYIKVYKNRSNIPAEYTKMTDWVEMTDFPFEVGSVLMYCSTCGSLNGSPVITSKSGALFDIPKRK